METERTDNDLDAVESALQALALNRSNPATISTLATASRESQGVREQLADPKALHALIDVIDSSIGDSIETLDSALRCLGNACADNDNARDIVTSVGFLWAVRILESNDETTQALVIQVLYNICNEHDASQQALYRERLHYRLIKALSFGLKNETGDCGIELLFWITGHKAALEPTLHEPIPMEVLSMLLLLPKVHHEIAEIDTFGYIVQSVLEFLRDNTVQNQVITNISLFDEVHNILAITNRLPRRIGLNEGSGPNDDLKILQPLEIGLLWVLSDCAARAEGHAAVALCQSRSLHFLSLMKREYEDTQEHGVLLAGSCQEVGNLIRNVDPQHWAYLVEREHLHTWLYTKVLQASRGSEDAMMLHSIAGLLIQLTRASEVVCEMMVEKDDTSLPAVEFLCRHEMPQVRHAGIQLLKRLGASPKNQQCLAELGREVMTRMKEESQEAKMAEMEAT